MSIHKVSPHAFSSRSEFERAVINADVIGGYAFNSSRSFNTLDVASDSGISIKEYAFQNCASFQNLILRSNKLAVLSASNALNGTPFLVEDGAIYVPSNLVSSYKSATNWSSFSKCIFPISEYPKTNFDNISDSWSEIFSNPSYNTDYAVNDSKTIELIDGTKIKMRIAAFDTDDKSDDSGKAKITWISNICPFYERFHSGSNFSSGGWPNLDGRARLIDNVLSKIPSEIRNHIVSVKKTYLYNDETAVSDDSIWIPSAFEACLPNSKVENEGVAYSSFFSGNASRIKYYNSASYGYTTNTWITRSIYSNTAYVAVNTSGAATTSYVTASNVAYLIGFCTD